MADYTTVQIGFNEGTDGAADWTGNAIAFGGTAGANELRWQRTGGGGVGSTASASWPNIVKPGATAAVEEMWAFTANTTGLKVNYDGTIGPTLSLRFDFDANGSPASTMQFSAFQDTSDTTPTPGTQTANATDGSNIINGSAGDTGSTSYLKANAFGCGYPAAGSQETPATTGNAGTTCLVTSGTAGPLTPGAGAWLTTWQSLQGWTQYTTGTGVVKVTTAFFWYLALMMFVGPNMQTGNMVFCPLTLQYTWT